MRSTLLVAVASLASSVICAPTSTQSTARGVYDWSPTLAQYYDLVDKHIRAARDEPYYPNPPSCDLSKAVMPIAPTPLPSPNPSYTLKHVAIGRGVQNYTCANSSATPVSIGALANLYNASCIAANYPDILSILPNVTLQNPVPEGDATLPPNNLQLSGHHYFRDKTTPLFNLNLTSPLPFAGYYADGGTPETDLGIAVAKKNASSPAPADAPKGQNGVGDGSVAWLYLTAINGTTGGLELVYRVNTAGGNPPATCDGQPASISVEYASEYWFYSNS